MPAGDTKDSAIPTSAMGGTHLMLTLELVGEEWMSSTMTAMEGNQGEERRKAAGERWGAGRDPLQSPPPSLRPNSTACCGLSFSRQTELPQTSPAAPRSPWESNSSSFEIGLPRGKSQLSIFSQHDSPVGSPGCSAQR